MAAVERYKCPDCSKFVSRTQFRDHPAECPETVSFNVSHFVGPVHGEQIDSNEQQNTTEYKNLGNFEGERKQNFLSSESQDMNDCFKVKPKEKHLKQHLKIHNNAGETELTATNINSIVDLTNKTIKKNSSEKVKQKRGRHCKYPLKKEGNLFICTTCNSTFETVRKFQKHVNEYHRDIPCTECGQKFPWECFNCSQHVKRACYICMEIFID